MDKKDLENEARQDLANRGLSTNLAPPRKPNGESWEEDEWARELENLVKSQVEELRDEGQ